jgi:hypothetical protein|tara:strand:- start:6678 stop:6839 length:162 start_codon:yes stop_codon:yes gene_type:complete
MYIRKATDKVLELVQEGMIDKDYVILCRLKYMSEDEVKDMAITNEMFKKESLE